MRSFIVQLPDSYVAGTPSPLAFAWRGLGGTAEGFLGASLSNAANANDTILVVPQALEKGGQASFDPFSDTRRNYDLAFYDDMLTCLQDSFSVEPTRVYTTGMSNGGLMTGMLIAARSSDFAAAAPWSGGMQIPFSSPHDKIPALVSWGGPNDFAYEQSFDTLANVMIDKLVDEGHFVVSCNHMQEHVVPAGGWDWAFEFLLAHEQEQEVSPFESGLSYTFLEYCEIATLASE